MLESRRGRRSELWESGQVKYSFAGQDAGQSADPGCRLETGKYQGSAFLPVGLSVSGTFVV